MIKYNLNNINDWYHDDADIVKVYYNGNVVYHKVSGDTEGGYESQYLTLRILTGGTVILPADLYYSLDDGQTWTETTVEDRTINANAGDAILLKGESTVYSYLVNTASTAYYDVEGNIMSTQYGDNFVGQTVMIYYVTGVFQQTHVVNAGNLILPATTLVNNAYTEMFYNCSGLISAPELPATTLTDYCYQAMFEGCTSLVTAPELPATTLDVGCYASMFKGCTSLTTAPELPATSVPAEAYGMMFDGCTSLTASPALSATTLETGCYYSMFNGCTSLNSITCLATSISANNCTRDWVVDVASSGTFIKAASMSSWTSGDSGIPNNWTIQNDDGSPYINDNWDDQE